MAKALAKAVNLNFKRIQFTPDLLPADILGSSIYNPKEGKFFFGPARYSLIFYWLTKSTVLRRAHSRLCLNA